MLGTGRDSWVLPLAARRRARRAPDVPLTALQQHYLLRLETRMAITTSARFLRHVLRLPVEFFTQRQPADIAARMLANDRVAQILSRDLATAVVGTVMASFFGFVLLVSRTRCSALIGIGAALLNLLALRFVARIRRDATSRLEQDRGKVISATYNGIALIETLKSSRPRGGLLRPLGRDAGEHGHRASSGSACRPSCSASSRSSLTIVSGALILLVGGRPRDRGRDHGRPAASRSRPSSPSFRSRSIDLADVGTRAQEASADIDRLDDVERYPVARATRPREGVRGRRRSGSPATSCCDDVTFGYNPLTGATDRGLLAGAEAGRADRARRPVGQRQVDGRRG